ncbi:hypothetical protein GCM10009817_02320 [Terrabacter lapilli]|uniref:Polysaccharide biosynthesis protein n=2 Tax=Terrabacter lapilli TaxID=436231 RepID=A0ABN2RA84_9MICO
MALSTVVGVPSFYRIMGTLTPRRGDLRAVLQVSGYAHVSAVGFQALYRLDVILLSVFASRSALGVYSVAVAAVALVWSVAEAFALRVFASDGTGDAHSLRDRDWRFIKLNALVSLIAGVVLGIGVTFALPAILPAYNGAVVLIWLLLPGVIAQGPARVALASLQRMGGERWAALLGLVALVSSSLYIPSAASQSSARVAMVSSLVYVFLAALTLLIWKSSNTTMRPTRPVEVSEI